MKQTAFYIGFFLLLMPSFALAQVHAQSCSAQGYTVVFVNGIFGTEFNAQQDKKALQDKLHSQYNGQSVTVQLGYNPSHLAGLGDLAQTAAQATGLFGGSISNFDLNTILLQIYPEVTTRKLMFVGHSQGAFYNNEMYAYLLGHGEPAGAVGVYNVASPASYTAGGGKYLNSSTDATLQYLRAAGITMLPNNIYIDVGTSSGDVAQGHYFGDVYLAKAGDRIVADINSQMSALSAAGSSDAGDCFTPPQQTLGFKAEQVGFAVADPTATVIKVGVVTTYQAGAFAINTAATLAAGAYQFAADAFTLATHPPSEPQAAQDTLKITNKLYGSSLDGLSAQDKKDLLGSSQGGAVALAVVSPKAPATNGQVLGTSTDVGVYTPTTSAPSIFPSSSNGPVLGGGGAPGLPQSAPLPTVAPIEQAPDVALADDESAPLVDDAASTTDTSVTADDSATTTTDVVQDTAASDTPSIIVDNTQPPTTRSLIASQEDSSGTPSHYWHSDSVTGAYLVLDPNDGKPGFSIGTIATTTTNVIGIHVKVQVNALSTYSGPLPNIPVLYDESGTNPYTCPRMPYNGYAFGTASDAMTGTNPLMNADYDGKLVDMYFQCYLGVGHDQVYPSTSYRLYFYPISTADISDIYVAMNAAGTEPFYEISSDGTY